MKYLFILLLSNLAFANFIKKSEVETCNNKTVYMKKSSCGEDCIKIDSNYNCEYSEIKPEKQVKAEVEDCLGGIDCQEKLQLKFCQKGKAIKNLDTLEVYCTYLRPEIVGENESKKVQFENDKRLKEEAKEAKKQAKEALKTKKWKNLTDQEKDELIQFLMELI